eukprot:CAMPEP_0117811452 /NCGR_PEP_ID=MMETSP0948-20121206/22145_1 /TAXON_ID=44440 /ORGANISM="Chattonella subsalsa, Strain CCMP2191" /LENGTH=59 /DNA_ID=CAMNT_0005648067 /DNA_START=53 /DNA_END=229 /DNA_ORIENTATION=+
MPCWAGALRLRVWTKASPEYSFTETKASLTPTYSQLMLNVSPALTIIPAVGEVTKIAPA